MAILDTLRKHTLRIVNPTRYRDEYWNEIRASIHKRAIEEYKSFKEERRRRINRDHEAALDEKDKRENPRKYASSEEIVQAMKDVSRYRDYYDDEWAMHASDRQMKLAGYVNPQETRNHLRRRRKLEKLKQAIEFEQSSDTVVTYVDAGWLESEGLDWREVHMDATFADVKVIDSTPGISGVVSISTNNVLQFAQHLNSQKA